MNTFRGPHKSYCLCVLQLPVTVSPYTLAVRLSENARLFRVVEQPELLPPNSTHQLTPGSQLLVTVLSWS